MEVDANNPSTRAIGARLSSQVTPEDITLAMVELAKLVPPRDWSDRLRHLLSMYPKLGPPQSYRDKHKIEIAIAEAFAQVATTGEYFQRPWTTNDADVLAFLHVLAFLLSTQGHAVRGYCTGQLRNGLGGSRSLRIFALELRTYLHAFNRGFDVEPTDMLGVARHDFLATKNGKRIAVECKHVDSDTGMAISYAEMADTIESVWRRCASFRSSLAGRHVALTLPAGGGDREAWAEMMVEAIRGEGVAELVQGARASIAELRPNLLKIWRDAEQSMSQDEFRAFLADLLGVSASAHLAIIDEGEGPVIFSIDCAAKRKLLPILFGRLREDAKKQLPSDRAGALVVGLSALDPDDDLFFSQHDENSPLLKAVTDLFQARPHLFSITFASGRGNPVGPESVAATTSGLRQLSFVNRAHPEAEDGTLLDFVRLPD